MHAIVLGGGVAGLLAARVLGDAYDSVTVLDRDELPTSAAHRRGVPQSRHVHALLARGRDVMEELLPGLTADLVRRGAPIGDLLADARWYIGGDRHLPKAETGLAVLCASRPLLETYLRERVQQLPNVTILARREVVGLTADAGAARVTGVRTADGAALRADLVIDAGGRGSRAPHWLEELGYQRPAVERVQVDVRYSSRVYRLPRDALGGDIVVVARSGPGRLRSGVMHAIEDGRWLVTLAGRLGERPPTDPDGFVAFAATLPAPDIHEVVRAGAPVTEPAPFRFAASVRHRYERLTRFPAGLLVLGDAVGSFNPVYAQGMSVAALEALTLRQQLAADAEPVPARFLAEISRVVDAPWSLAAGSDLASTGMRRRRNAYLRRLTAAALDDPEIARAFIRVAGMVDEPCRLMRPRLVARTYLRAISRRTQPTPRVDLDDTTTGRTG